MSNLPPCGACSYTSASETVSISISSLFIGTLSNGRLTLRSNTGALVTHEISQRLVGGQSVVIRGLAKPAGNRIDSATLSWSVSGDPEGRTTTEETIFVEQ